MAEFERMLRRRADAISLLSPAGISCDKIAGSTEVLVPMAAECGDPGENSKQS